MECIEARALKSSFLSELGMKSSTQQALFEDFWDSASDEFSVDDLLDLSGEGFFEEFSEEDFVSVSSHENDVNSMNSGRVESSGDLASLPAGEIPVPVDDMENLEWLSQIVDDSASEISLLFPPAFKPAVNRSEPALRPPVQTFTVLGFPYPVPRKYRTNRSKKLGRVWSLTESTSTPSSSHDSSITPPIFFTSPVQSFMKPPSKKSKKNPVPESGSPAFQRRCTHCQVQKTPQWRTGPLGPKTLCNACGVRFKSGRLFPEYRPACSPTFSGDVHSNSHRKVLEMRKKNEPSLGVVVQTV